MKIYKNHFDLIKTAAVTFTDYGFDVIVEYPIAGSRVDLFAVKPSGDDSKRIAVECKFSTVPVGISRINPYAYFSDYLRSHNKIDKSIIVTNSEYTISAKESAAHHNITLLLIDELDEFLSIKYSKINPSDKGKSTLYEDIPDKKKILKFFVAMPFHNDYNDIFIIGIREVTEKLGVMAIRVDEIEHNGSIPDLVIDNIKSADFLIAEATEPNKNVFYEIGVAHGLGKEIIFLCKTGTKAPFDLAHINHIFYGSLIELRTRLESRIKNILDR